MTEQKTEENKEETISDRDALMLLYGAAKANASNFCSDGEAILSIVERVIFGKVLED